MTDEEVLTKIASIVYRQRSSPDMAVCRTLCRELYDWDPVKCAGGNDEDIFSQALYAFGRERDERRRLAAIVAVIQGEAT